MLKRKVKIGDEVCTVHIITSIDYNSEYRTLYVSSFKSEDDIGNPTRLPKTTALQYAMDTTDLFAAAYQWLAEQPEFAEYQDPLDEVLPILTDEQASQVVDVFPEWTLGTYAVGDRRRDVGALYKCIQAHTAYSETDAPHVAVSLWVKISEEETPEWVQPTGAHDAYEKGAKVKHNSKIWSSDIDYNVYEPGVYGWTEETEE